MALTPPSSHTSIAAVHTLPFIREDSFNVSFWGKEGKCTLLKIYFLVSQDCAIHVVMQNMGLAHLMGTAAEGLVSHAEEPDLSPVPGEPLRL